MTIALRQPSEITPVFDTMEPQDVVFDFDGPRTFSFTAADGGLYLAHEFDGDGPETHYLVIPARPTPVRALLAGTVGIRAVLEAATQVWRVETDADGVPVRTRRIELADVPDDHLPRPGAVTSRGPGTIPRRVVE